MSFSSLISQKVSPKFEFGAHPAGRVTSPAAKRLVKPDADSALRRKRH
jgi:hypothetical protein